MSESKDIVLTAMKETGMLSAKKLQEASSTMSGTELYAADSSIPDFVAAKALKNMLERHASKTDGFICKSSAGSVVRLIQNYDSDIYTDEPEKLPAQWAFVWSQDPKKALPFFSLSTSPYNTLDCCTFNNHVWQSGQDNNVWEPGTINVKWTDLGTIESVMGS